MDRTRRTTIATRWFARTGNRALVDLVNGLNAAVHDGTYRVPSACKLWTSLNALVRGVVIGANQWVVGM